MVSLDSSQSPLSKQDVGLYVVTNHTLFDTFGE